MAEVTVRQLAEKLNVAAETLLTQMRDAGLSHSSADEGVSDTEKEQLLGHLKRAHGKDEGEEREPADGKAPAQRESLVLQAPGIESLTVGGEDLQQQVLDDDGEAERDKKGGHGVRAQAVIEDVALQ